MAIRHQVLTKGKNHFLLSVGCAAVASRLKDAGKSGLSYSEIVRMTKISRQSVYVFAQRLRNASLIGNKTVKNEIRLVLLEPNKVTVSEVKRLG